MVVLVISPTVTSHHMVQHQQHQHYQQQQQLLLMDKVLEEEEDVDRVDIFKFVRLKHHLHSQNNNGSDQSDSYQREQEIAIAGSSSYFD